MSTMIERVDVVQRAETPATHPWLVMLDDFPGPRGQFRVHADAVARAKQLGRGHWVKPVPMVPGGWVIEVHVIGGGSDLTGFTFSGAWGFPFETEQEAQVASEPYRARIGVIDQRMMGSSVFEVIVLRVQNARWTAALGVGSHTIHVPGSHETLGSAQGAAERLRQARWEDRIWYWTRIGARAGLTVEVQATLPPPRVVQPQLGQSAWNALEEAGVER